MGKTILLFSISNLIIYLHKFPYRCLENMIIYVGTWLKIRKKGLTFEAPLPKPLKSYMNFNLNFIITYKIRITMIFKGL